MQWLTQLRVIHGTLSLMEILTTGTLNWRRLTRQLVHPLPLYLLAIAALVPYDRPSLMRIPIVVEIPSLLILSVAYNLLVLFLLYRLFRTRFSWMELLSLALTVLP